MEIYKYSYKMLSLCYTFESHSPLLIDVQCMYISINTEGCTQETDLPTRVSNITNVDSFLPPLKSTF